MSENKSRRRRIIIWITVVILGAPLLFVLFEFVVPKLLPANF